MTTERPSDAELLSRVQAGESEAVAQIYERHRSFVYAVISSYHIAPADVDEVAQSTWVILISNAGRIREPNLLRGWLATVARHEANRPIRRRQRQLTAELGGLETSELDFLVPPDDSDPSAAVVAHQSAERLQRAVGQLSPTC